MVQWFLILGIAALPFVYSTSLMDPEQSIRFAYLPCVGIISLIACWFTDEKKLLRAVSESVSLRNPVFLSMLVLFACTLFSVLTASQKSDAWVEVVRVGSFLFFFIWITILLRMQSNTLLSIAISFCMIGLLSSVFALKDFFALTDQLNNPKALYGMTGHMGHRNLLAIMLTLCLPFHVIVLQHYTQRWLRALLVLNMLLIIAVISLSTSRVGFVGLAILLFSGSICIGAAYRRQALSKTTLKKIALAFALFILVSLAGTGYYVMKNPVTADNITQRWTSFFNYKEQQNEHTETIRERLRLWKNTVEIIKEHPLTGVGAGNWKFHFPGKGMANIRSENGRVHFPQPHNDFLWVWAEAGLPGLIAFVTLFISAIMLLFKKAKHADGENFVVLAAAMCGISAYFFESLVDFPKERPVHLFALACYLAIAGSTVPVAAVSPTKLQSRIILVFIFLMGAACFSFWAVRVNSEMYLRKAFMARAQGNYAEVIQQLSHVCEPVFKVDLTGTPLDWYRGEAAFYRQDVATAKKYFESSLHENPYHLYTLSNLGTIYYVTGDTAHAIENWQRALSIAPGFADGNLNMAIARYDKGDITNAAAFISRFRLDKTETRHHKIITVILRAYITQEVERNPTTPLTPILQKIAESDTWLIDLQEKMVNISQPATRVIWEEAIYAAETLDHTITPATADSLRKFYNSQLDE